MFLKNIQCRLEVDSYLRIVIFFNVWLLGIPVVDEDCCLVLPLLF